MEDDDYYTTEAHALFEQEDAGEHLPSNLTALGTLCFEWYLKGYTARGKDAQAAQKPCDLPCPQCGSQDVLRRFYAAGERMEGKEYGVAPSKYVTGPGTSVWKATKDHLAHLCRVCQYSWASKPLAKED